MVRGARIPYLSRRFEQLDWVPVGILADLVILNGDVLQDFSALHRPLAVFREGRLVHGTLPER
jgi:hypothetical protein